jgi:hypothetical protein
VARARRVSALHRGGHVVEQNKLHLIEDILVDTWVEDFAEEGIDEAEEFLAKYKAFDDFLDERGA